MKIGETYLLETLRDTGVSLLLMAKPSTGLIWARVLENRQMLRMLNTYLQDGVLWATTKICPMQQLKLWKLVLLLTAHHCLLVALVLTWVGLQIYHMHSIVSTSSMIRELAIVTLEDWVWSQPLIHQQRIAYSLLDWAPHVQCPLPWVVLISWWLCFSQLFWFSYHDILYEVKSCSTSDTDMAFQQCQICCLAVPIFHFWPSEYKEKTDVRSFSPFWSIAA